MCKGRLLDFLMMDLFFFYFITLDLLAGGRAGLALLHLLYKRGSPLFLRVLFQVYDDT